MGSEMCIRDSYVDQCPETLRECARASADMPGGPEMVRVADRIDDETPGDHTRKFLPGLSDGTTEPTTPQVRAKRVPNCSSPGSGEKPEPPASSKKRYRITLSAEYWDKKINGANSAHDRKEPQTPPTVSKVDRMAKMRGRDEWVKACMDELSGPEKKTISTTYGVTSRSSGQTCLPTSKTPGGTSMKPNRRTTGLQHRLFARSNSTCGCVSHRISN